MATSKRKTLELAQRRKQVVALYLQGRYQWEIGECLGVDRGTVSRDLKAIHEDWLASGLRDFDADKARELERIDHLERTYWLAWERSQGVAEAEPTAKPGGRGRRKKTPATGKRAKRGQARAEPKDGNPAFLAGVQWCISKRCAILGLDAPQRVSLNATEIDREIERLMADVGHSGAPAPDAQPATESGGNAAGAGHAD